MNTEDSDHFLDITDDVCPMTFVKSKLAFERANAGEVLKIRVAGAEPVANVPRALVDAGAVLIDQVQAGEDQIVIRVMKPKAEE